MTQPYAQLVLSLPDGSEQVYELFKPTVSIGRGWVSDISLQDGKISRAHARLEFDQADWTLEDLGSVNGTLINGMRVERARLSTGDVISLGDSVLRFEIPQPAAGSPFTPINEPVDLEHALAQETLLVALNDTSQPRLVIHSPEKTWEVPLVSEQVTIGRSAESDVHIAHSKVSRRHALIEHHDQQFVVKDLKSVNGSFFQEEPFDEHILQPGDTIRIGPARLVYKAPFALGALAPASASLQKGQRLPVVILPGFMGSDLWQADTRLWPDPRRLFNQPELYQLPEQSPLEARAILNEPLLVPNLLRQAGTNHLSDYLVGSSGYQRGVDLLEFPYDWRQDVRQSARRLAQVINERFAGRPFAIIACGLGGLVARYYIEALEGKAQVVQAIFVGVPHSGSPLALTSLFQPADLLPWGSLGDRSRQLLATFPSLYQMLPRYDSVIDQDGNPINLFDDDAWLPEDQRPLLRMAREFWESVGVGLSVPSLSIFGYGRRTIGRIEVQKDAAGAWAQVGLVYDEAGDARIPACSATLAASEIYPIAQYHGSLLIDPELMWRIKRALSK